MAIVRAVKSGNWSDPTVWNTGALPTSADDVYSNTFTVTIDTSPTVLSISNAPTTGVTSGGIFVLSANGLTLTCTGAGVINGTSSGNTTVLASSPATGATVNIVANITGGTTSQVVCVGLGASGLGTINITGNVSGGTGTGGVCHGISITGGFPTINITGNVNSGTGGNGGITYGITGSGAINVTGNVTGGTSASNPGAGILATGAATLTVVGQANASNVAPAISSIAAVSITHTGTITPTNNIPAVQSTSAGATVILSGPFLVSANGTHAVLCPNWKWQNTTPPATYYQIRSANLSVIRPLYTADSVGGNPATSNVRAGTVYGPNNELTGTMAVPPTGSVAFGVPVDNTTGTAILSLPVDFWNYPLSGITTSGSIGERLKSAATVNQVGTVISNALR